MGPPTSLCAGTAKLARHVSLSSLPGSGPPISSPQTSHCRRKSSPTSKCVETSFLNTGQLASPHLRYMVAGDIAGAWGDFGSFGALPANLSRLLELSAIPNMGAAPRFEHAQRPAWSHLARERGSLQLAKDELIKINRDRLHQCVGDQMSEIHDRKRAHEGRFASGRYRRAKRFPSRMREDGSNRAPKRGRYFRGRSPKDPNGS